MSTTSNEEILQYMDLPPQRSLQYSQKIVICGPFLHHMISPHSQHSKVHILLLGGPLLLSLHVKVCTLGEHNLYMLMSSPMSSLEGSAEGSNKPSSLTALGAGAVVWVFVFVCFNIWFFFIGQPSRTLASMFLVCYVNKLYASSFFGLRTVTSYLK